MTLVDFISIAGMVVSLALGTVALFKVFANTKVTNALQTNHIEHLKEELNDIKKDTADLWKEINKMKSDLVDCCKDISFIKGKFNGK